MKRRDYYKDSTFGNKSENWFNKYTLFMFIIYFSLLERDKELYSKEMPAQHHIRSRMGNKDNLDNQKEFAQQDKRQLPRKELLGYLKWHCY